MQFRAARRFFARLPQNHVVIWNGGPRVRGLMERLAPHGLWPIEAGKGRNVWGCIGYLIACADSAVMAIHDCDIVFYKRDMLSRLVCPVAHPAFSSGTGRGPW